MTNDIDISPEAVGDLVKRLRQPPFGTETSERNLMAAAAERIEQLEAAIEQSRVECANLAAWQCVYTDGKTGIVCDEYGNQFCQQSRDLTQSRAETAAAYEQGMRDASGIVIPLTPRISADMMQGRRDVRNAILAAIPKGSDK